MYCLSLLLSQNIVKILSIFSKYHKEVAVLLILVSLSNFYLIHKFLFGNFRISKNTCAQSLLLSDPNQLVYPIHSLDLNLMILGFAFLELLFSLPRNYDTSLSFWYSMVALLQSCSGNQLQKANFYILHEDIIR